MIRVACLVLAAALACTASPADRGTEVVTAFYPLAYVAERVGGDRVLVHDLTPAGAEPHDVELAPDDLEKLGSVELVVYLGAGFQPALEDALRDRQGMSLDLLDGVELLESGNEHAGDPHIWLDPKLMIQIVQRVRDGLSELAPHDAETFAAGAERYAQELRALDQRYATALATCERRTIVVAHAAFGYLAARYELEQLAIAGISPTNEPDAKRLGELAELVRREGVTTIFTETLVDASVAETLADEAGVSTDVLDPIEGLRREQIDAGEDYLSVMDDNLARLKAALGCG